MAAFSGSALVVKWIYSGTTVLTGDQRTFSYTPSIDLIDQTAGGDPNKTYLTAVKDGRAQMSALFQDTTTSGGTATFTKCGEGYSGTIEWYPEGTALGKSKYTMPAICMGAAFTYPYADVTEVAVEFQQNGARTEGTAT